MRRGGGRTGVGCGGAVAGRVSDAAGRWPGGVSDAAGRWPGGVSDAAGRWPGGVSDAAGRWPGGVSDAAGRWPGGVSDAAGWWLDGRRMRRGGGRSWAVRHGSDRPWPTQPRESISPDRPAVRRGSIRPAHPAVPRDSIRQDRPAVRPGWIRRHRRGTRRVRWGWARRRLFGRAGTYPGGRWLRPYGSASAATGCFPLSPARSGLRNAARTAYGGRSFDPILPGATAERAVWRVLSLAVVDRIEAVVLRIANHGVDGRVPTRLRKVSHSHVHRQY
ncbi:hypothetical protein SUDANB108_03390 [Streptomyces sp. enrichment culture]